MSIENIELNIVFYYGRIVLCINNLLTVLNKNVD
jgi:hypothetical protein